MVHAFCQACDLAPIEVAVVGDNPHDLEMARQAGAGLAIGVLSGNSNRKDFGALADAVLGDIAELPAYLERL
jgi:phosphoglycolate phosphatase